MCGVERSINKDLLQFVAIKIWKLICVLFDIVSHIHFKRFVGSPRKAREFSKFLWRGNFMGSPGKVGEGQRNLKFL